MVRTERIIWMQGMRGSPGRLRIEAIYLADDLRHLVDAAEGNIGAGVRGN
jgi:hypothetical protein